MSPNSTLAAGLAVCVLSLSACKRPVVQASEPVRTTATPVSGPRQVRATGTIQAVRAFTVQVPQITGQNGRLTLIKIAPNGTSVKQGDVLAEFDRTQQVDAAREAQAKFEDLGHQVQQKEAQNLSDAEKRSADIKQAEADLSKAQIELRKGPILSDIDRQKNEIKAASAALRVESLKSIDRSRRIAEAAALRILQLQTERQKVALDRARTNSERLLLHAPLAGMVALENVWRNGSMGNAQEGDQLWNGQPLLKIFDPSDMEVRALIGEPDGASLKPGAVAMVYIDAYPDAVFRARFHSASPVATSALGSPIKNFTALFRLDERDSRILPDLSAAIVVRAEAPSGQPEVAASRPPSREVR
jgi:HlyD family secretion protein